MLILKRISKWALAIITILLIGWVSLFGVVISQEFSPFIYKDKNITISVTPISSGEFNRKYYFFRIAKMASEFEAIIELHSNRKQYDAFITIENYEKQYSSDAHYCNLLDNEYCRFGLAAPRIVFQDNIFIVVSDKNGYEIVKVRVYFEERTSVRLGIISAMSGI